MIDSFKSMPTFNQALNCSMSMSFFTFFAAGGADDDGREVSESAAGLEPIEGVVVAVHDAVGTFFVGRPSCTQK